MVPAHQHRTRRTRGRAGPRGARGGARRAARAGPNSATSPSRGSCRELGIVRCTWLKVRVVLELYATSSVGAERASAAARRHPKRFEIDEAARTIAVRFTPEEAQTPFRFLKWVFAQLRRDDT